MATKPARCTAPALLLLALFASTCAAPAAAQTGSTAATLPAVNDVDANPDYYTYDLGVTEGSGHQVYIVCVSPWSPFVFYNSTSNTLTGYEWDLFLAVSHAMGLTYDTRVMGWNEMMINLARNGSDPDRCDIAPTSIPVTPDLVPLVTTPTTVQFSIPTYHSGYVITTAVSWASFDRWSFGRVFTIQLWAVLLGSALLLSVLTYLAEHDFAKRGLGKTKYPTALRPGMYEAVYNCVGKLFNVVQDLKVTSLAGKLISMGWGFLVLVASTTYTAGVTAAMTSLNFQTTISGVNDLPHYRVITWDAIVRNFLKYGFIPTGMPWLTESDGLAMLETVAKGGADALVLDYPWLRYQLATRCDLAIVGQPFHYVDNAVGFSPGLPSSFIDAYNAQLVTLQQDGMYEQFQDKYLKSSQCPSMSGQQMVVTFKQLEGLWIVLGAVAGLAIVLLLLPHLSSRFDTDIKRTRSMFDIRGLGKSFVSMARKSFKKKDNDAMDQDQDDVGDRSLRTVKAIDLHDNPSYVEQPTDRHAGRQERDAVVAAPRGSSAQRPAPSSLPREPAATQAPQPAPASLDKDSVVPFVQCERGSVEQVWTPGNSQVHQADLEVRIRSSEQARASKLPTPKQSLHVEPGPSPRSRRGSTAAAAAEDDLRAAVSELKLEEAE